jgi:CubicO group peptidase (beta-lactamase class C family)
MANTLTETRAFLSDAWLDHAQAAFAPFPVDEDRAVRFGLAVTDAPPGLVDSLVFTVDMVTGGIRFDRTASPESANPTLYLTREAAARLLLGSPADRVGVFETGESRASGNFTELFFLDQVLQQDTDGVLAELRATTEDLPADLGGPDWPSSTSLPPGQDDVTAATEVLPRTMARLYAELRNSTPGAQLYVSQHGRTLANLGIGMARPGVPFTRDSSTLWYCCAKPLGSVAVGWLWERGLIDPFAPVSRYLPDFAGQGRERLTLAQLLTHTGPVPTGRDPLHGSLYGPDELRHRLVRGMSIPDGEPGRVNYSQWWAWVLLSEVIRAVDGRDYDQFVTEEILIPCGIADTTRVRLTGDDFTRIGDKLPLLYITAHDRPAQPTYWFSSRAATTCALPGVNTRGPMADLGRFLEMLLAGGTAGGRRILAPPTVAALVARHRNGISDRFGNADWGLGFRLECRHIAPELTSFSKHASPRAYGHEGLWTAVAFADPDAGLVVAAHLNGKTRHDQHRSRILGICDAVYEDLVL